MLNEQQDIKKPIPCNQNWSEMLPTDGGRICLGCGKLVSDFRKYSWADIAKVHSSSPIPVCGIYSEKQINSWGHEIYSHQYSCSKLATISATLLALSQFSTITLEAQIKVAQEQTQTNKQPSSQKTTIEKPKLNFVSGTIVILQFDDKKIPLSGASIIILQDSSHLKTISDSVGRFVIDITSSFGKLPNSITLFISHPDFMTKSITLNKTNLKALDITFSQEKMVSKKPSQFESIKDNPDYSQTSFYITISDEPIPEKKWWQFWK
jgi:hypothetical protein